jgi:phosphoenolpyruvate carboxykinase (ATP)
MVHAIYNNDLAGVPLRTDPHFKLQIPEHCPGVPEVLLDPRRTWQDPEKYDQQARLLVGRFQENFTQFAGRVSKEVADSGPTL